MPFADFLTLYSNGTKLWVGRYEGLYPLPANGFFAAFALLPQGVALFVLLSLSLVLFVSVLKRKALVWIFFVPVLQCLWLGQIDLIAFWLLAHFSPVSLALLTLKPHLFVLAIPQLIQKREMWKPFLTWCAVLYVPVTLIRPTWVLEWIHQMNDGRIGAMPSLYWVVAIVGISVLVITHGLSFEKLFWCFNPALRPYDFSLLAGKSEWLIPVSLLIAVATTVTQISFVWVYLVLGLVATFHPFRIGNYRYVVDYGKAVCYNSA